MIVGVVGHRPNRLPADLRSSAALRIRAALIAFAKRAERHATPTLICGLAEGSDRYAARAALRLGWRLHALLPLPPDDYADDFDTSASRSQFKRYLAAASDVDQPSPEILKKFGADGATRPTCYLAQGLDMLSRIDGLIAVWDGGPSGGAGGTVDIMERAQKQGLLVHLVRVKPPAAGRA